MWTAPNPQSTQELKLVFLPKGGLCGQRAVRKGPGMPSCSEFSPERRGRGPGPPGTQLFRASEPLKPALAGPAATGSQTFIVHPRLCLPSNSASETGQRPRSSWRGHSSPSPCPQAQSLLYHPFGQIWSCSHYPTDTLFFRFSSRRILAQGSSFSPAHPPTAPTPCPSEKPSLTHSLLVLSQAPSSMQPAWMHYLSCKVSSFIEIVHV